MDEFNQRPPDERNDAQQENGVIVPYEQISPEALRAMIEEYITRDWSDFGDDRYSLEGKVEQVMKQLKNREIQVVFNLDYGSANIVKKK